MSLTENEIRGVGTGGAYKNNNKQTNIRLCML